MLIQQYGYIAQTVFFEGSNSEIKTEVTQDSDWFQNITLEKCDNTLPKM